MSDRTIAYKVVTQLVFHHFGLHIFFMFCSCILVDDALLVHPTILNILITFMVRQAHHERNWFVTFRPEIVEGLTQFLWIISINTRRCSSCSLTHRFPEFLQPFDRYRIRCFQFLRKQGDAQFFDLPAEFCQIGVADACFAVFFQALQVLIP